jgi:hypothetical protein
MVFLLLDVVRSNLLQQLPSNIAGQQQQQFDMVCCCSEAAGCWFGFSRPSPSVAQITVALNMRAQESQQMAFEAINADVCLIRKQQQTTAQCCFCTLAAG